MGKVLDFDEYKKSMKTAFSTVEPVIGNRIYKDTSFEDESEVFEECASGIDQSVKRIDAYKNKLRKQYNLPENTKS